jgi:urease subunit alpha
MARPLIARIRQLRQRSLFHQSPLHASKAALESGSLDRLNLRTPAIPVQDCRSIGKSDMVHNSATPQIQVDPETYEVRADGELLTCEPAVELPLAQRYFLF